MKVTQLHTLINAVTQEVLGDTAIIQEDLSNVVDIGKSIIDSDNVDNYVKKLVNHIGKVVFVNRLYTGGVPSVLMDSWEYGSILEKISADLPEATVNESWNLKDGENYSPDTFYKPSVSAKFFNSKVTFEIPMSFTEIQVKESFSSKEQLNGFISMLTTSIENAMTVKLDALIMRTINNMTAETLVAEFGVAGVGENDPTTMGDITTGVKAVNLLSLYNDTLSTAIAASDAITNPDFIRFATYQIGMYSDRMAKISTLFNVEKAERFTPKDLQHIVLLSDFAKASEVFLKSNTDNAELVALPKHETVPYWQGSGTGYSFDDVSAINVKTASKVEVSASGILGVIFDRDALGVSNLDRRVTTNYNPRAEFYTNFYKFDAGYYNDLSENFVVFFVADAPVEDAPVVGG
jgi:hypothetical protein